MKRLAVFLCVSLCLATALGADDLVPLIAPPPGLGWLTPEFVAFVETLPIVGPALVLIFQYVGFIAALFTALTVFVAALLQAARAFAWSVGLERLADGIHKVHRALNPYLAYLSIFNVPPREQRPRQ